GQGLFSDFGVYALRSDQSIIRNACAALDQDVAGRRGNAFGVACVIDVALVVGQRGEHVYGLAHWMLLSVVRWYNRIGGCACRPNDARNALLKSRLINSARTHKTKLTGASRNAKPATTNMSGRTPRESARSNMKSTPGTRKGPCGEFPI